MIAADKAFSIVACRACNGTGTRRYRTDEGGLNAWVEIACHWCNGYGDVIVNDNANPDIDHPRARGTRMAVGRSPRDLPSPLG